MRCIEIYQVRAVIFSVTAININMRCIEMIGQTGFTKDRSRLTLTWDVLKSVKGLSNFAYLLMININMRCIEITDNPTYIRLLYRLTLTWDVLKSKDLATLTQGKKININMRCIEMLFFEGHSPTTTAININMRCIEMPGQ